MLPPQVSNNEKVNEKKEEQLNAKPKLHITYAVKALGQYQHADKAFDARIRILPKALPNEKCNGQLYCTNSQPQAARGSSPPAHLALTPHKTNNKLLPGDMPGA
jgi:hypothetical protein